MSHVIRRARAGQQGAKNSSINGFPPVSLKKEELMGVSNPPGAKEEQNSGSHFPMHDCRGQIFHKVTAV